MRSPRTTPFGAGADDGRRVLGGRTGGAGRAGHENFCAPAPEAVEAHAAKPCTRGNRPRSPGQAQGPGCSRWSLASRLLTCVDRAFGRVRATSASTSASGPRRCGRCGGGPGGVGAGLARRRRALGPARGGSGWLAGRPGRVQLIELAAPARAHWRRGGRRCPGWCWAARRRVVARGAVVALVHCVGLVAAGDVAGLA